MGYLSEIAEYGYARELTGIHSVYTAVAKKPDSYDYPYLLPIQDLRDHLGIIPFEESEDDVLNNQETSQLTAYLRSANSHLSTLLCRPILPQTYEVEIITASSSKIPFILLPFPNVLAVHSVKTSDRVIQTSDYIPLRELTTATPTAIIRNNDVSISGTKINCLDSDRMTVQLSAGFTEDTLPDELKQALLMSVAYLYRNAGDDDQGLALNAVIAPYLNDHYRYPEFYNNSCLALGKVYTFPELDYMY